MSGLGAGSAFVWAALSAQMFPGLEGPATTSQVRLLADVVQPHVIQPGEIAIRRVTLHVADGVSITFPDALSGSEGTEPSRSVQLHRQSRAGGVRWVLSYPFTAWTEGDHRTGSLSVEENGPAGPGRLELGSATVVVASPLPTARLVRPAPAEAPRPVTLPPWTYLPLIPAALSVVTGAALWKRSAEPGVKNAPAVSSVPEPSLRDVLECEHENGAVAAIAIARAARGHPALEAVGARPCHTTPEILALAEKAGGPVVDTLAPVLAAGDASAFGARRAESEHVIVAGWALLGALDDD